MPSYSLLAGAVIGAITGTAVVVAIRLAYMVRDAQRRAANLQTDLDHARRELANARALNSAALVALDSCLMDLRQAQSAQPALVLNGQTYVDTYYTQGVFSLN